MTYKEYANLFLEGSEIPCAYQSMSGPSWGFGSWRSMLVQPWLEGQTMGDVNYLNPHLLTSEAHNPEYDAPQVQMTPNWVYIINSESYLSRYSTENYEKQDYNPNIDYPNNPRHYLYLFAIYSDNVIYTLEEDLFDTYPYNPATDYDNIQICKVTFSADGNVTKEIIYEFSFVEYIDDEDWLEYSETYYFGYMKYEDNDCIVHISTVWYSIDGNIYYWKVIAHHIETGETTSQMILGLDDPLGYISDISWESTSPAFIKSKLIFSYITDFDFPNSDVYPYSLLEPIGSHCYNPVFVLDISNDSVEIIQDFKVDCDVDWAYIDCWDATAIIDYNTNRFYWINYYSSEYWNTNGLDGQFIFGINIDTPHNMALVAMCPSTFMQTYQGPTTGYEIDLSNAPGVCNILSIPYQGNISTVNAIVQHGSAHNEAGSIISIEKNGNMLWNIRLDRLEGKSLIGGENKDIMINWEGGAIPFTYPGYQYKGVLLQILDSMVFVGVYSSRMHPYPIPDEFQMDWYLLKHSDSYTLPTLSFSTNDILDYVSFDFTFSDESEMSVDWGDEELAENNVTHLEHTYSYADFYTITLSCPDFTKLTTFMSDSGIFTNTLPSFAICESLTSWEIYDNSFTSTIPGFGNSFYLVTFDCHNNNLNGELSDFTVCSNLAYFNCSNNNFSGNVRDFSESRELISFQAGNNNFTGFEETYPFYFALDISSINFENNSFTQIEVDKILHSLARSLLFVGPRAICTLNLEGSGMSSPSEAGYIHRDELVAAGWTVLTN